MVFPLIVAGAALAATAVGGYMQYSSSKDQAAAQQAQIAAEKRAESIRRRSMELDARRRTMEVVRQQQRTRAAALAMGTAQGSSQSTGLQGAFGAISGQTGVNALGIAQNLQLGQQMFKTNAAMSDARMAYAQAGEQGALGRGISSIGSTLFGNIGTISSLGAGFGSSMSQPMTWGGGTSNPYMASNAGSWY